LKQTRTLLIKDRVFTSKDLVRLSKIIEDRGAPIKGEHTTTGYEIRFDDNTKVESDSPEILHEEWLTERPRATAIAMRYRSYTLERFISVDLTRGDTWGRSEAEVGGRDTDWVNSKFFALEQALKLARPQNIWLLRHPDLVLHIIALGLGSLVALTARIFGFVLAKLIPPPTITFTLPFSVDTSKFPSLWLVFYMLKWVWVWFLGICWGAFPIRRWLFNLWPTIEFDFGLPHFQIEKIRRERLALVATLVVIPILITLITDWIEHPR